jgi:large subunit ribosomal protein L1
VHVPFGNSNFSDEDLLKNLQAAVLEIQKSKPSASKGTYFKSTFISITQGPGLQLAAEAVLAA